MALDNDDDRPDLAVSAHALGENVKALSKSVGTLSERIARSERAINWTVLGMVLIAFLAAGLGWVVLRQEQTRSEVLCPLYSIFLGSYSPNSRAAGADRDAYERAFAVLREGNQTLGCKAAPVPPRTDVAPSR